MRMYDLIVKKRKGEILTEEEIRFMITEYVLGNIPDYQMSAMLMAICFQGMNDRETAILTDEMASSGEMEDLSAIDGIKVDKHSTGGVGDKTTLIVGPIVASCGVKVAKMSGRGLGHTGGTVDKLESIPGLRTGFNRQEFFDIVNKTGICLAGQSGNLAPADKKIYALRDVTGTVDSIPLIAASIMSKKLASGSDGIVLDVKTGSGAFMKDLQDALQLAKKMMAIGTHAGKRMAAVITNMDSPLGNRIGNALEVEEAIDTLQGKGPEDLTKVCLNLAANMLYLGDKGNFGSCMKLAQQAIDSGEAFKKFAELVQAQGGDVQAVYDVSRLPKAEFTYEVRAGEDGYLTKMDTEKIGIASSLLGAGRFKKEDRIDFGAGIVLKKKIGNTVRCGETLAVLYTSKETLFTEAEKVFLDAVEIGDTKQKEEELILKALTDE